MIRQQLRELRKLSFKRIPSAELPDYAFALACCRFPASTNLAGREIADFCQRKLSELRVEALKRIDVECDSVALVLTLLEIDPRDQEAARKRDLISRSWDGVSADPHVLRCVLSSLTDPEFPKHSALKRKLNGWVAYNRPDNPLYFEVAGTLLSHTPKARRHSPLFESFSAYLLSLDYSILTPQELLANYRLSPIVASLRQYHCLEPLTRGFQTQIVSLLSDKDSTSPITRLLRLAETLEADNYSRLIDLPFRFGELPSPFNPGSCTDDLSLIDRIRSLSHRKTYVAREQLISIADHIQLTIIALGLTADHLPLIDAILSTGMPCFDYPRIAADLERTTLRLARSNSRTGIELAPIHHTLWILTSKVSHLARFERTLRHCYFTLTSSKTYPDLGLDPTDGPSLTAALSLLTTHHRTLQTLSPTYTLTPLLNRYPTLTTS